MKPSLYTLRGGPLNVSHNLSAVLVALRIDIAEVIAVAKPLDKPLNQLRLQTPAITTRVANIPVAALCVAGPPVYLTEISVIALDSFVHARAYKRTEFPFCPHQSSRVVENGSSMLLIVGSCLALSLKCNRGNLYGVGAECVIAHHDCPNPSTLRVLFYKISIRHAYSFRCANLRGSVPFVAYFPLAYKSLAQRIDKHFNFLHQYISALDSRRKLAQTQRHNLRSRIDPVARRALLPSERCSASRTEFLAFQHAQPRPRLMSTRNFNFPISVGLTIRLGHQHTSTGIAKGTTLIAISGDVLMTKRKENGAMHSNSLGVLACRLLGTGV